MAAIGTMIIDGETLEVWKATLRGNLLGEHFYWELSVNARGAIDGELVEPCAYSVNLLPWQNRVIACLDDLIGEEVEWEDAYDEATGTTQGNFYLYSHDDLRNSKLRILRRDGRLRLEWNSIADTDLPGDRDSDEYALSIDTELTFEGYLVYDCRAEDALGRLRAFVTEETLGTAEPWIVEDHAILRPIIH